MTEYVVVVQKYTHVTKRDDRDAAVKWTYFHAGDVIELDEDDANTRRLLKSDAIVTLATWQEAQAAQPVSQDEAELYRNRIAELEAALAAREAELDGDNPASVPPVPAAVPAGDADPNAAGDGFDDPGTGGLEDQKRPANSATVDRWRAYAAARVAAEAPEDEAEQLAKIDDPDTDRAYLIRTYGSK